ncbi:UBX domain-containing protein 11-like isoform X3 [Mytilus californianus]|uniref:UBX domain-containing protein 11-like isoform X3 n=1 Tax=Mytilus californianus TaxID=6549 RepID=UPI0022477EC0|nr:UBX domain-containing protein 11-like isoform X3 [Mytilus californianus]
MSSPLSSLKKSHKQSLLPGSRSLPFRHPEYSEDESRLLEEITTNMATARMKLRDPFIGGLPKLDTTRGLLSNQNTPRMSNTSSLERPPSASSYDRNNFDRNTYDFHNHNTFLTAPSDHDLMSAMMSKITALETRVVSQGKEISEKDKRIKILEEKLQIVQASKAPEDIDSKTQALERKCLLLQQNVHEMETFLADYGMVWIGEKSDPNSDVYNDEDLSSGSSEELWRPESSLAGDDDPPPPSIDYDKILENIKDLNVLAGDGISRIQHTTDGARLKMPDPVDLALYANGIMMYSGPFRPFSDPPTQHLLKDILDGYFPSELQTRYPNGIPFVVKDFRHTHFEIKKPLKAFKGVGQTLGGGIQPSRLVASTLNKTTQKSETPENPEHPISVSVTSKRPGKTLTKDQFLNKLPQSVVKGGKIVDIRNTLNEHLSDKKSDKPVVTVVETETVNELKKRLELEESVRPSTPRNITTLRIKSETGNQTYILKMKFNETVGDLRKYLNLQRSPAESDYIIVSAYPNKTHTDDTKTLEASGLVPNAVLHLRQKKGSTS